MLIRFLIQIPANNVVNKTAISTSDRQAKNEQLVESGGQHVESSPSMQRWLREDKKEGPWSGL